MADEKQVFDEVNEGGRYSIRGQIVDANGEPVKGDDSPMAQQRLADQDVRNLQNQEVVDADTLKNASIEDVKDQINSGAWSLEEVLRLENERPKKEQRKGILELGS